MNRSNLAFFAACLGLAACTVEATSESASGTGGVVSDGGEDADSGASSTDTGGDAGSGGGGAAGRSGAAKAPVGGQDPGDASVAGSAGSTLEAVGGAGATGNNLAAAGQGGADDCVIGEAQNPASPDSLDLFGQISYFSDGAELPAGRYRVTYVDGCMKYQDVQDWSVHAFEDGSIAWYLGAAAGNMLQILPGTYGFLADSGGFAEFEECVEANRQLDPIDFDFSGGVLGIWLADSPYSDNVAGLDGRNPIWKLERLDDC